MNRIALIHAMRESMPAIEAAFVTHWPEAECVNLLDDSLPIDRTRAGRLSGSITARFLALGRYARDAGADGILFTCSAFGPAIEAVQRDLAPIPVHKPNQAMIAAASHAGGRIGLLASFAPTLESMVPEFPPNVDLVPFHCAGALQALVAGDGAMHDRISAAAALKAFAACDRIALAQFSLARAKDAVAAATGLPVLTTPDCAVLALRADFDAGCVPRAPAGWTRRARVFADRSVRD